MPDVRYSEESEIIVKTSPKQEGETELEDD